MVQAKEGSCWWTRELLPGTERGEIRMGVRGSGRRQGQGPAVPSDRPEETDLRTGPRTEPWGTPRFRERTRRNQQGCMRRNGL